MGSGRVDEVMCRTQLQDWQEMTFSENDNLWKARIRVKDEPLNELTIKATNHYWSSRYMDHTACNKRL